ncbi:response regulator [Tropicimonas isoalkanivorans]|uniref:Sigma-70, region 4 n=1 Tax=Tropicimonas isoalkanivorans TaxID=441112 RepID=A0A1I1RFB7_9RHOB|nr:response regulator [Tropicimonas isoalkanivorans]SFD29080.1 Sigma-70, region 4 [Tropicimonas isoalkanivorans]
MTSKLRKVGVESIAENVPYLRRYARALTGSQATGDKFAAATLEAIIADDGVIAGEADPKVALFRPFHVVWASAGAPMGEGDSRLSARAQHNMSALTPNSREALLLYAIEGFSYSEIARILGIGIEEARESIEIARNEMEATIRGDVMIIEDDPVIAMDLSNIVGDMGHRVSGIAQTRQGAVDLADRVRPDLILADIQLADMSSGLDAVNDILDHAGELPVIFITAFPERFLTGIRPEPAFLITKPFTEDQVRSAVSQGMFFASTETLSL